jgi:hypothetical protein
MPSLHTEWTVLPHGPVEAIDHGILCVAGEVRMPLATFPRRMTIAALGDGGCVVFSPICLGEQAMREVEQFGDPRFMIVPNGFHRLDARPWKQRYPELKVLCPPGAKKRVARAVPVDATRDIMADDAVDFIIADGVRRAESALLIRRSAGRTLVINDLISHVRHPRGLGANIIARLLRFGVKRPEMAREVRYLLVDDKAALAAQFRAWAELGPRRIIPSHGDIIDDPVPVLSRLAAELE